MELQDDPFSDETPEKRKRGRQPGQRTRTTAEIHRDREQIINLKILHRKTDREIEFLVNENYAEEAEETEIIRDGKPHIVRKPHLSLRQVQKEIEHANRATDENITDIIVEERKKAIRQYERFAAYCFKRHEETLAERRTKTVETREGEKGDSTLDREVTVNTDGNTKYLDLYERAMWRIAELKAIIPPKKVAPTNPEGTEAFKFEGLEEDKRLAALAVEMGLSLIAE